MKGNGIAVADLLSFRHPHVMSARLQNVDDPEKVVVNVIDPPLSDIVIAHLQCIQFKENQDYVRAYEYQGAATYAFSKVLQSQKDENWALPVMYTLCTDLRRFAITADAQMVQQGKGQPGEILEKAADGLMSCFRVCAADNRSSEEDTKRWGTLNVVNQLFQIYFRINKLPLCKPLIRTIETSAIKDSFPVSQLVMYRYFVGRNYMFEGDYKSADEFLSFAFENCPRKYMKSIRSCLIYLVPVKMLRGCMPTKKLLEKYSLLEFQDVAEGVKQGNLLLLNQALKQNEAFFTKSGIYLILEKLKTITYRNLFKKVYLISGCHQIPVDSFLTALKMSGVQDADSDEAQCILANLIAEGKIKGYISFKHQKVVVSKTVPFPSLTTLAA